MNLFLEKSIFSKETFFLRKCFSLLIKLIQELIWSKVLLKEY